MIEAIDRILETYPDPQARFNFIRGLRGMWERKHRQALAGRHTQHSTEEIEALLSDLRARGDQAIKEMLDARR